MLRVYRGPEIKKFENDCLISCPSPRLRPQIFKCTSSPSAPTVGVHRGDHLTCLKQLPQSIPPPGAPFPPSRVRTCSFNTQQTQNGDKGTHVQQGEQGNENTVAALEGLLILWEIRTGKQLPRRYLSLLFASYILGRKRVLRQPSSFFPCRCPRFPRSRGPRAPWWPCLVSAASSFWSCRSALGILKFGDRCAVAPSLRIYVGPPRALVCHSAHVYSLVTNSSPLLPLCLPFMDARHLVDSFPTSDAIR